MDRPPKTEEKSSPARPGIPAMFRSDDGDIDLARVLTFILAVLLILLVGLTWLPTHLSDSLLLPAEALFLVLGLYINGRIYKSQPPHAKQLILAVMALQVVLIEVASWFNPSSSLFFQYFVLAFQGYRFFNDKIGLRIVVVCWFAYALHSLFVFHELQTYLFGLLASTLGLVLLVSRYRHELRDREERVRRDQLLKELEVSHRQLKAYADQVEELATIQERNRLAREIHDSLGHYLTAINIQLEKAMLQHEDKPAEAMQTISETKRLASEALQDVRRSVATLREQAPPSFSIVAALQKLVSEVQHSTRFSLDLSIEGNEQGFSNQVLQTLYRVAQEGLTNIQKYANPQKVLVRLELAKDAAYLLVQDDGSGFDTAKLYQDSLDKLGGYGLQGIRERLELVGGHFQLESAPGRGTTLKVSAPKDPFQAHVLKTLQLQS